MRSSRVHMTLAIVWAALAFPTVTVWRDSIWWIGLISIYANFVSHWGAFEAARAKEKVE
jgi:hypothetical protein